MRLSLLAISLLIFLLTCVTTPVEAQLYKWVDKDGNVSYSDVPPPKDAKDVRQKNFNDNVTPSDDLPYSIKEAIKRNPVTLFANACGELCDSARALLSARGIPFANRNPETDPAAMDALKDVAGGPSVPTLTIGGRVIKGFTDVEWHEALTSAGYPRTNPGIRTKSVAPAAVTPVKPAAPAATATPAAVN
jgi:glutaredoxin